MAENIRVAIRVRPFNSRETKKGCKLVVAMPDKNTVVLRDLHPDHPDKAERKFNFDYCYWSHDGSNPDVYATQQTVFEDLGKLYVQNAFDGFNASLFAYGQTGAGKSFSMMGTEDLPGIVPLGCEELFRRKMEKKDDPNFKMDIEVSFLEIYNETVKDLLPVKKAKKPTRRGRGRDRGLPIRQNPKTGPYVQGLARHAVDEYADIKTLIALGMKNRAVAATKMNPTSSRGHSIFTIYVDQTIVNPTDKTSKAIKSAINLIDLAGSERQSKTGATGQRFEEAKSINLSLTALGTVINALSECRKYVPYRSSVLTRLLEQSLGGNAKTVMLAAISPADDNLDETLSTLRYAARAKSITNKAEKNEHDKGAVERELRLTVQQLRNQLDELSKNNTGKADTKQMKRLQEELEEREREFQRLKMSHEDKVKEMREFKKAMIEALEDSGLSFAELGSAFKIDPKAPRLVNISVDPEISGTLIYFLRSLPMVVGTAKGQPKPAITLQDKGGSIQPLHVLFSGDAGSLFIEPHSENKADKSVHVNGRPVTTKTAVYNGDRILLGRYHMYQVIHPENINPDASTNPNYVTQADVQQAQEKAKVVLANWEETKKELADHKGVLVELEEKLKAEREKDKMDEIREQQRQAFHRRAEALSVKLEDVNDMSADIQAQTQFSLLTKPYFDTSNGQTHTLMLVRQVYFGTGEPMTYDRTVAEFYEDIPTWEDYYHRAVQTNATVEFAEEESKDNTTSNGSTEDSTPGEFSGVSPFLPEEYTQLVGVARVEFPKLSELASTRLNVPIFGRGKMQMGELIIAGRVVPDKTDSTDKDASKHLMLEFDDIDLSPAKKSASTRGVFCTFVCVDEVVYRTASCDPEPDTAFIDMDHVINIPLHGRADDAVKYLTTHGFDVYVFSDALAGPSDAAQVTVPGNLYEKLRHEQEQLGAYKESLAILQRQVMEMQRNNDVMADELVQVRAAYADTSTALESTTATLDQIQTQCCCAACYTACQCQCCGGYWDYGRRRGDCVCGD